MTTSHVTRINPGTVVSADGNRVAYQRVGEGSPIIVLPGALNGGDSWRAVAEHLADAHTIYLVDRRGYPPSDEVAGVSSFTRETADVLAMIEHVGGSAHVLGHSYGGLLALHTVLADPSGIRSLMLYEAPVGAGGPHVAVALRRYREQLAAGDAFGAIFTFLTEVVRVSPEQMSAMVGGEADVAPEPGDILAFAKPLEHDMESIAGFTFDARHWSEISVPTLLMSGADSWDDLAASSAELRAALPAAKTVSWPGQTHFANMLAPELVADSVREFLWTQPSGD